MQVNNPHSQMLEFFSDMSLLPKALSNIVCEYFQEDERFLLGRFEEREYSFLKNFLGIKYCPRFLPYGNLWKIQNLSTLLISYKDKVNSNEGLVNMSLAWYTVDVKVSSHQERLKQLREKEIKNQLGVNQIRKIVLNWETENPGKSPERESFAADQITKINSQFKITKDCLDSILKDLKNLEIKINDSFKKNNNSIFFENFDKFDESYMTKMEPLKTDEILSKSIVDNLVSDKDMKVHNFHFQLKFANSIFSNPDYFSKVKFYQDGEIIIKERGTISTREDVDLILGILKSLNPREKLDI